MWPGYSSWCSALVPGLVAACSASPATVTVTTSVAETELPDYWVDSGSFRLNDMRVTGGSTVDALDLSPGRYALVCAEPRQTSRPCSQTSWSRNETFERRKLK